MNRAVQVKQEELRKTLTMGWPSPQDYNEALQNPASSLIDPDLASGETELNALGLPRPRSGMFACVYKVHARQCNWAVRCFLQSKPDQLCRYIEIKETLKKAALPCLVPFDFQETGIRVAGHSFPILKMIWCEGEPLNHWLAINLRNKPALEEFLEKWRDVIKSLSTVGIAHGDLQHGNVLINKGEIKLVDYDGVYIPAFAGMAPTELGHRSYQHPLRDSTHFGPYLDNFSAWLIYISVLISGCDPHIWHDFEGGDECLLFRKQDLDNPLESELFHVLEHHHNPQIRECSKTLRYLLTLTPENVPGLEAPIIVPDNLPELDSVISDLPEWFPASPRDSADSSASIPIIPDGKRLLKRRRRRGAPLYSTGKQTASGRWIYNEQGLSFAPVVEQVEEAAAPCAPSTPPTPILHSPILDTFTAPAPYRNIRGKLHSPLLEDALECNSTPTGEGQIEAAVRIFPFAAAVVIFVLIAGISLGSFHGSYLLDKEGIVIQHNQGAGKNEYTHVSEEPDKLWPHGQYHRLYEGLSAMEDGRYDWAEKELQRGASELQTIDEPKAYLNLANIYDNLGKIHNAQGKPDKAVLDFRQAMEQWQHYSGIQSTDYSRVVIEYAESLARLGQRADAEKAYKQGLQTMLKNIHYANEPLIKEALVNYAELLRKDHRLNEAAKVEALLTYRGSEDVPVVP